MAPKGTWNQRLKPAVCPGSSILKSPFGWVKTKAPGYGPQVFGPCFHLPGFHFGYIFLTHSHSVFLSLDLPAAMSCTVLKS